MTRTNNCYHILFTVMNYTIWWYAQNIIQKSPWNTEGKLLFNLHFPVQALFLAIVSQKVKKLQDTSVVKLIQVIGYYYVSLAEDILFLKEFYLVAVYFAP